MGSSDSNRGCSDRARGGRRAWLASVLLAAVGLLIWCAPASALIQRGHVFDSAFASEGSGDGQLSKPSGVAVSEVGPTAGDVYVVDRGNNRIVRFGPKGEFIATWGFGVQDGAKEYEVCTSGCQAGTPNTGKGTEKFHLAAKGQLISPEGIAIDNDPTSPSAGDVYVVADVVRENSFVDKFSPEGEFKSRVTKATETEEFGRVDGVSVDTAGQVWVAWSVEGRVTHYTNAEKNKRVGEEGFAVEGAGEAAASPGFAVDSHDNLYLNLEPGVKFVETEEEETPNAEEGLGKNGEEPCSKPFPCFVTKLTTEGAEEEGERRPEFGEAFVEGLFGETSRAMAVDLAKDDLYVNNETSVAAYTAGGLLIERFGAGQLEDGGGRGVAVNSATGQVYVVDAAAGKVNVYSAQPPAQPTVEQVSVSKIATGAAELSAQINPTGADTTVTFQYGTAACGGGTCTSVPAGSIGAGFEDQGVSTALAGLAPGTTYHFRVLATNSVNTTTSEERTFTTLPVALADNRAWEQVSPVAKNGVGFEALTREGGLIQASEDGSGITFVATGPSESNPEGNLSPQFTQSLAKRIVNGKGELEWSSKEIVIPQAEKAPGVGEGLMQEYQYFSPDLSLALVQPYGRFPQSEPALSPEATEKTIYVRKNEGCQPPPSSCYTPLVTPASDTAEPELGFGGKPGQDGTGVRFVAATPDLSHVVLQAEVPLTSEAAAAGTNLYEWTAGKPASEQLRLINVLPGGTPATGVNAGILPRHFLSKDGSRVFWEAGNHLYLFDATTGKSIQIDTPEAGVTVGEVDAPVFQAASTDGSKAFFTDPQRLTTESTSPDRSEQPDLYEFDVETGKLTDLTTAAAGESVNVQGLVSAVSDDGNTVYYVANGVLTSDANEAGTKATPGNCQLFESEVPGSTCSLYTQHFNGAAWSPPAFIATLSNQDLPDWGQLARRDLGEVTSRTSPDGHFLSFMSQRPLTGYDNRDANPTAGGARDQEVFLYDSGSGSLRCVSCKQGAQPSGVFDTEESGEGLGLLVDRPVVWLGHWLAGSIPGAAKIEGQKALYQPRYLSDNGRLFFNSTDALVPTDENGKNDVYEYEPPGEGTCADAGGCVSLMSSGTSAQESAFLDASVSGNDVFFLTAGQLVPKDNDSNLDVYDARVCSAGSPCVTSSSAGSSSCNTPESCKGPAGSQPSFGAPASANISGPASTVVPAGGVLPRKVVVAPKKPTRAQLLSKALKSCKKLKKKKKRVACEKTARKKFGAKKASKKKKGKK